MNHQPSLFEEYPPICRVMLRGKSGKQKTYIGHPDTLYPINPAESTEPTEKAQDKIQNKMQDKFYLIGASQREDPKENLVVIGIMNFDQNRFDEAKLPERKALLPALRLITEEVRSQGSRSKAAVRLSYFPTRKSPEVLIKDLQETEWKIQEILKLQRYAIHFRRAGPKE